jgi:hypothetical protein
LISRPAAPSITRPFATDANIPTAAVGLITEPEPAEHIIAKVEADAVFLARAMLRNPRWALMASENLGTESIGLRRWNVAGLFKVESFVGLDYLRGCQKRYLSYSISPN